MVSGSVKNVFSHNRPDENDHRNAMDVGSFPSDSVIEPGFFILCQQFWRFTVNKKTFDWLRWLFRSPIVVYVMSLRYIWLHTIISWKWHIVGRQCSLMFRYYTNAGWKPTITLRKYKIIIMWYLVSCLFWGSFDSDRAMRKPHWRTLISTTRLKQIYIQLPCALAGRIISGILFCM